MSLNHLTTIGCQLGRGWTNVALWVFEVFDGFLTNCDYSLKQLLADLCCEYSKWVILLDLITL